jgi:hypothetical protein
MAEVNTQKSEEQSRGHLRGAGNAEIHHRFRKKSVLQEIPQK